MVGITHFGAYVPLYRLGDGTEAWEGRGERAIASFDEDSITMAVAAGLNCLGDVNPSEIDALYFASTTSPFKEKQAATLVAKALDLNENIFTADFGGSLRAGTTALRAAVDAVKAGSAKSVLVIAAEQRIPQPRSESDGLFGDGAAAYVIGQEGVVAAMEDFFSCSHEIYDVWRSDSDVFPRSAENRFVFDEGYLKIMKAAAANMMDKMKLTSQDFAKLVCYAPNPRRHTQIGRSLGFDDKTQLSASFFGRLGDTGCAFVPMMLVEALEGASAGEMILMISYGEGADASVIRTSEGIGKVAGRRGMSTYLDSKKILPSYITYLRWRELVDIAHAARRPPRKIPGVHTLHREAPRNISLYGTKCLNCGTIQYPDERVCTECQAKDRMEPFKMSRRATLFTYAMDYLGPTPDPPMVVTVVDFDGGGRGMFIITDKDIAEWRIGMPLEMSFRKLYATAGINNYFWCATPLRA